MVAKDAVKTRNNPGLAGVRPTDHRVITVIISAAGFALTEVPNWD